MVSNDKWADIRALRIIEIRNILQANVQQQNEMVAVTTDTATSDMVSDLNKIDKLVDQMKNMPASTINQARAVLVGASGGGSTV